MNSDIISYRQYLIIFILILLSCNLFAGETGKIAGKIIDKTTEEALIGANVLITGVWIEGVERPLEFTYGAASDFDGNYFILNVRKSSFCQK